MQQIYKIAFTPIDSDSRHKLEEVLTLEDALKLALENNYDIKIATNNSKIDATQYNSLAKPNVASVNANLTNSNSIFDTKQTQADGSVRELDGAKNMNLSYGVGLDWTIFDGLSMFAQKEQLNVLEQQGKAELQTALLNKLVLFT